MTEELMMHVYRSVCSKVCYSTPSEQFTVTIYSSYFIHFWQQHGDFLKIYKNFKFDLLTPPQWLYCFGITVILIQTPFSEAQMCMYGSIHCQSETRLWKAILIPLSDIWSWDESEANYFKSLEEKHLKTNIILINSRQEKTYIIKILTI